MYISPNLCCVAVGEKKIMNTIYHHIHTRCKKNMHSGECGSSISLRFECIRGLDNCITVCDMSQHGIQLVTKRRFRPVWLQFVIKKLDGLKTQ